MNERTKELVINARDTFTNGVTETSGEIYIHGSEENLEKFSKLIINECRDLVISNFHECRSVSRLDKIIRDHFGVK